MWLVSPNTSITLFHFIHHSDPLHIYKIFHTVFRFSHFLTSVLPLSRPGLSLWPAFYPPTPFYINLFHFAGPHRSLQILTLLPYLEDPACHRGRSRLIPSPYPICTSLFPLTDPHRSLQLPHRSSQFLSLIYYPIILPIGPACHCGRSRLLHSFNSIYISLLPFTDPHRSSQIPTLLSYLFLFILPHRSSQSLPDPHKSLQLPLPHFKDPHRSLQIPTLLPYLEDPTCHRGSFRLIPSPYPICTSLFPLTDPHRSLQLPHKSSQILTISPPHSLPYYFTYRPGLSLWQVLSFTLF